MISVITPVYKETQQQIGDLIVHLSGFENVSQIIIAATDHDSNFSQIQSFINTYYQQVEFVVASAAGRAIQMNSGAESSHQQYLLFLHCDTRLPDEADELIIDSLSNKQWGRFDIKLDDHRWVFRVIAWFINKRSRLTRISTGDQAIFVKQSFFERLGGFPNQVLMEDIEFCKRAKREAEPGFINCPVITSARRWQQGGITKTILLMWWLRLLNWFGVSPDQLAKNVPPNSMSLEPALILFAKKPVAGDVKTRLSPPLSAIQAREVAQILIQQSLKNVSKHWPGTVELSLWPDLDNDFVQNLVRDYDCILSVQSEGNLGDKMFAALSSKQSNKQPALIMGCDVPHCPSDILRKAYQNLQLGLNVIGPTLDGGYYCIGTQSTDFNMFDGVDWGSERAYAQTIASCGKCGIEFNSVLPELRDLDCYDDLVVISEHCSALKPYLI